MALAAPARATSAADQDRGPLAANGFTSPWCEDPGIVARLSPPARSNCANSGVAVASAPIGNYQFDVHIDSGPLGLGGTMFAIALQDLVLTPVWTALVWLIHALLVALEWCYSLDLLGSGALRQVGEALRTAQATFTQPWLVLVLAVAAVVLIHQGIVRRRVTDSLGEAALMTAMIVAGLCLIADPAGTVGEVSRTVNDASLATVAAIDAGTPEHSERSFADALGGVFRTTVTAPWCYLEFGDVRWCSDPARVDPRLRAAALALAADDRSAGRLGTEANLLSRAQTNGEFTVALPANGVKRNSINDSGSLLRAICQTADATACSGPSAAQAEFRTQGATWSRAGGLLFIAIGAVGVLAVLGFVGVRLLSAALLSVLYLLLAPVFVLAPAFGDRGRGAFRGWAGRLFGALVAKLVYSVVLGVVLLMLRILLTLDALGWWTQWLLIAAFWWVVFIHRHELLGHVFADDKRRAGRPMRLGPVRELARAARVPARVAAAGAGILWERLGEPPHHDGEDALRTPGTDPGRDHEAGDELMPSRGDDRTDPDAHVAEPAMPRPDARLDPSVAGSGAAAARADRSSERLDPAAARSALDEQVQRLLATERADAESIVRSADAAGHEPGDHDELRRRRLREQIAIARERADKRRLVSLTGRLERVDAGIEARRTALATASTVLGASTAGSPTPARREQAERELERQAALARGSGRGGGSATDGRDYEALSALTGIGRAQYGQMAASERRRVRLEVDRELERRREWTAAAATPDSPSIPRTHDQRRFTREQFEELLG